MSGSGARPRPPRAADMAAHGHQRMGDAVTVQGLGVSFGPYRALDGLDLRVGAGEFLALVGPTGCGKSTLLNVLAGLLPAQQGHVAIAGNDASAGGGAVGYLFQQEALLPWKTVGQNVELGLRFARMPAEQRQGRVDMWLRKVGLAGLEARYPHQLSGGQRKRAQLAQVLATGPQVLLMDEPFSSLDVHTRQQMHQELLALWEEQRCAVVLITHDLEEAIALADRVLVLAAGPASHVVREFGVTLPRPRRVAEVKLEPGFLDLYRQVWSCLRIEVDKRHAARD
ncbi:MAG TPA: ABC transporter ATP-binding protein [Stenotrophomonas sp.]|nr:ABC transporter ATP-binding protein [Stenotrophomonas sp.]